MTHVTKEDVLKLAKLSNLSLSDDELKEFTLEIQNIITFVSQLQKLDLSKVEPTNQVTGLSNVMRSDTPIDYKISREALLSNVPYTEDNYIKVKRVI
ncbi:MAG TPA: Asp-tRNA(Asn)/Glu-tRNA(Gln) amidotransferase subunit GatC [Candidatus Saccharimonadia bacterium]|nr:Asp-tRNA(Asn)/Glu-tRNA(Gln) amidotransferase subunit GatC [Candidatus Saccharimonadia bacterium]